MPKAAEVLQLKRLVDLDAVLGSQLDGISAGTQRLIPVQPFRLRKMYALTTAANPTMTNPTTATNPEPPATSSLMSLGD